MGKIEFYQAHGTTLYRLVMIIVQFSRHGIRRCVQKDRGASGVAPFRRVFATCGTVGTRSRAIRGSTSDDRVGCSASDGRCAPARPALHVSTGLLPFLPCALASAD